MASHRTCPRCNRALPESAFARCGVLEGGRQPWCGECMARRRPDDEDYRRAYQRLYHAKRHVPARPRWRVDGMSLTLVRRDRALRIAGPLHGATRAGELARALGGAEADLTRGRGSFKLEAAIDAEECEEGMARLEGEGRAVRVR